MYIISKDTSVIIGEFPDGYRVINSQACENLSYPEYVFDYFKDAEVIETLEEAFSIANKMDEDDWAEYGISNIKFEYKLEVYKWINLGKSVSDVIDNTFQYDVMRVINTDVHKHSDGIVTINYDYYSDEWTILHNGYIRGKVMCTETDLVRASHNYCAYIKKANYNELKDIEMNKKIPEDWHIVIDEDSYELYYKGDIAVLGSIREGWEDYVMEYIAEESEIRNSCN